MIDVSNFGEKDTSGAYEPGTTFELPDGTKVDPERLPDVIGGKRKARKAPPAKP